MSTSAKAHSWDMGNPGRSSRLMPQTSHSAFCIAVATPRAPSSSRTAPMTSGSPVPGMVPRLALICGPITGYWDTADWSRVFCRPGSFLSTMFSTVTRTSSNGNSAAKP